MRGAWYRNVHGIPTFHHHHTLPHVPFSSFPSADLPSSGDDDTTPAPASADGDGDGDDDGTADGDDELTVDGDDELTVDGDDATTTSVGQDATDDDAAGDDGGDDDAPIPSGPTPVPEVPRTPTLSPTPVMEIPESCEPGNVPEFRYASTSGKVGKGRLCELICLSISMPRSLCVSAPMPS